MMDAVARKRALEQRTGRRIVLRSVHDPRPGWRGQVTTRALWTSIEYQDPEPGYFWHQGLIHELLDHLEAGRMDVTLWEECAFPTDAPEDDGAEHG